MRGFDWRPERPHLETNSSAHLQLSVHRFVSNRVRWNCSSFHSLFFDVEVSTHHVMSFRRDCSSRQGRVRIVGGHFSGTFSVRKLRSDFTSRLLTPRSSSSTHQESGGPFVWSPHLNALTFNFHPVLEIRMRENFIWSEVKSPDGQAKTGTSKPLCGAVALQLTRRLQLCFSTNLMIS